MNFEQWFDFYYGENPRISSDTMMDSQTAWTACKQEVLKILKQNNVIIPETNIRPVFNNDGTWYFGKIDVIKEIEEL